MRQQQNLDVQKQEQQKSKIQKQERSASIVLGVAILCFMIIYIYIYIDNLLETVNVSQIIFRVIGITIIICIVICCTIWTRAIKRQKKAWMNNYGQLITATVIRGSGFSIVIEWRDPQTRKAYRYNVFGLGVPLLNFRFQNPMPLWIDPHDPTFCYANRGYPRLIET